MAYLESVHVPNSNTVTVHLLILFQVNSEHENICIAGVNGPNGYTTVLKYMHGRPKLVIFITLDFSSLLKNHFECSFVSSECWLQSSNVCFEVRSDNLR